MRRVVLDTNIIVSALINPQGRPGIVFDLFMAGELILVVNDQVLLEYEDVLSRPRFGFPASLVNGTLAYIDAKAQHAFALPQPESTSDPDDQVFWNLAAANDAVLITGNMKHFFENPAIMTSAAFLNSISF